MIETSYPAAITVLLAIGQNDPDQRYLHDRALQEMAIAPLADILTRGQAAGEFGEDGSRRSIADVTSAETLHEVRAFKKAQKAAAKNAAAVRKAVKSATASTATCWATTR